MRSRSSLRRLGHDSGIQVQDMRVGHHSRCAKAASLLAVVMLLLAPGTAYAEQAPSLYVPSGWRSSLYPPDWRPGMTDAAGRFVHDFSYAGYHRAEDPLPATVGGGIVDVTAEPYLADNTGRADATQAIQRALDDVGRAGGGVVYLPGGTYNVRPSTAGTHALRIRYDNVVLRGAGRARTYLKNTTYHMRGKSVIQASRGGSVVWSQPPAGGPNLLATAPTGATRIRINDAATFKPGDWVVLRTEASGAWVRARRSPRGWSAKTMEATESLRRVVAVDGDHIVIDIPLRQSMLYRDRGYQRNVFVAQRPLREVGVEDLSMGMVYLPSTKGWGPLDYAKYKTSAYRVHGSTLIDFRGVVDGWMRRVDTFRPSGNPSTVHRLSNGIRLLYCRSITIQDVVMRHPQYRGAAGNGYAFDIRGSDCLLERCGSVRARHSFSFSNYNATGNVVRDSWSTDPVYATDFHGWHAAANLVEGLRLRGDFIDATYRQSGATVEHGQTTSQSIFWNTRGLLYGAVQRSRLVHSVQFGWGAVIGTSGYPSRIITDPRTDFGKVDWTRDLAQGQGAGATLQPRSLSVDQLERRRGRSGTETVLGAVIAPAEDAMVRDGAYAAANFGSETSLRVCDRAGQACQTYLRFRVGDQLRIKSARLVFPTAYLQSARPMRTAVYGAADGWRESQISWRTRPNRGAWLGATAVQPPVGRPYVVDVTDYVKSQQRFDGEVTLVLAETMSGRGATVVIPSREHDGVSPRLEIEVVTDPVIAPVRTSGTKPLAGTSIQGAFDRSFATAYANRTYGGRLDIDLGTTSTVSGLGVAFESGHRRIGIGEVQASVDGVTYAPVRGFSTAGDSVEIEPLLFDTPITARYVRLVGLGNAHTPTQTLNGYREVEVYGRSEMPTISASPGLL